MTPADAPTDQIVDLSASLVTCPLCGAIAFGMTFKAIPTDEYAETTVGGMTVNVRRYRVLNPELLCACQRDIWVRS